MQNDAKESQNCYSRTIVINGLVLQKHTRNLARAHQDCILTQLIACQQIIAVALFCTWSGIKRRDRGVHDIIERQTMSG